MVLSAHRLGVGGNKNVYIDCSDLAKFSFPSDSDPRNYSNLINGADITSRIVEGDIDESVPAKLVKDPLFVKDGGFSVRLLVLPSKTANVLTWLVAAPVDVDTLNVRATLAGADVDAHVNRGLKAPALAEGAIKAALKGLRKASVRSHLGR